MTVSDLMHILGTADPAARVAFLAWEADEDEVEDVIAVATQGRLWARRTLADEDCCKNQLVYELDARLVRKDSNVFDERLSVVILAGDVNPLSSWRFYAPDNESEN